MVQHRWPRKRFAVFWCEWIDFANLSFNTMRFPLRFEFYSLYLPPSCLKRWLSQYEPSNEETIAQWQANLQPNIASLLSLLNKIQRVFDNWYPCENISTHKSEVIAFVCHWIHSRDETICFLKIAHFRFWVVSVLSNYRPIKRTSVKLYL